MSESLTVTGRGASAIAFALAWSSVTSGSRSKPHLSRTGRPPACAGGPFDALLADRLGLVFRRQLRRQIDGAGEILAACDGVRVAGDGIFKHRRLEDVLVRQLAARRLGDRPFDGQPHVVVAGGD